MPSYRASSLRPMVMPKHTANETRGVSVTPHASWIGNLASAQTEQDSQVATVGLVVLEAWIPPCLGKESLMCYSPAWSVISWRPGDQKRNVCGGLRANCLSAAAVCLWWQTGHVPALWLAWSQVSAPNPRLWAIPAGQCWPGQGNGMLSA